MQQEVPAPLQLFCLLEHIWLLLVAAVAERVLALTAAQAVLAAFTAQVEAAAVPGTVLVGSSVVSAAKAVMAL